MSHQMAYVRQSLLALVGIVGIAGLSWLVLRSCDEVSHSVGAPINRQLEASLRSAVREQLSYDPHMQEIHVPEIDAALETIRLRLDTNPVSKLDWPVELVVVNNPEANAVTLPGGLILVYKGLLKDAHNAEEVAAVIAHEMGHVSHHDSMNAISRNVAIAAVLSAGGNTSPQVVQQILQTLTETAFSRKVEDAADRYAADLLKACQLRPAHLADFFRHIAGSEKSRTLEKSLSWLSSHPDTDSRIQAAEQADAGFTGPEKRFDLDWEKILKQFP